MPPKDFIRWDGPKVLVKSVDGEWVEAGEIHKFQTECLEPIDARILKPTTLNFTFRFQARFKRDTRLLQELGYLKRPKLTYKTNRKYQRPKHHRKH